MRGRKKVVDPETGETITPKIPTSLPARDRKVGPTPNYVEDRIASIDSKINDLTALIEELEKKKQELLNPVTMKDIMAMAKKAGLSNADIVRLLNLQM